MAIWHDQVAFDAIELISAPGTAAQSVVIGQQDIVNIPEINIIVYGACKEKTDAGVLRHSQTEADRVHFHYGRGNV